MPYQTKEERERARWMTLAETLRRISKSEDCDQGIALTELRKVLADGQFRQFEMKWEDEQRPFWGLSSRIMVPDDTPAYADWNKAKFRLKGEGFLLDNFSEYGLTKKGNTRWRKLLFLRESVEKWWPPKAKTHSTGMPPSSDPTVMPFDPGKRKGPTPTGSKIVEAAKRLIDRGRTPTSCGSWEKFRRELCGELGVDIKARGYGPDTVQKAVRPLLKRPPESTERAES
jgi:hypothetical protein